MHGRSLFSSMRPVVAILAGFLLVSTAAVAAVLMTYNTPSTATLALKAPPVGWVAGPDSSGNSFVAAWTLSDNATYYTITLKPVPEANVTWGNLTTLRNTDTVAYSSVTVAGTSVAANTKILAFRLEFYDYAAPSTVVGALDLRAASPSLDLGAMPAGTSYFVKAYVKLDTGTGAQDLPGPISITLSITP